MTTGSFLPHVCPKAAWKQLKAGARAPCPDPARSAQRGTCPDTGAQRKPVARQKAGQTGEGKGPAILGVSRRPMRPACTSQDGSHEHPGTRVTRVPCPQARPGSWGSPDLSSCGGLLTPHLPLSGSLAWALMG